MSTTEQRAAPVKLSLPLDYQKDIFHELRDEDELVILGRGLGLLRIITNLLHSYDAAGNNLVVVVGAEERENVWIGEALAEQAAISLAPKAQGLILVNTNAMAVATRQKLYGRGGVLSITSQILIVDLLAGLLDTKSITGLVVLHADRVVATSLEAFILRIYRQQNKAGFLKAFSDNPESFSTGFAPLATMMRNLFLRRPSLWPRFHTTVAGSLEDHEGKKKAQVIELEVSMTESMRDIQNAVLDCVEQSISELKKANTGLEMEDWNVDSALHKNFDTIVRRQLDPVWHRTSYRTRMIVRDLTQLRTILHAVLTYDAVTFNKYLDTVLASSSSSSGSNRQNQSPWLFLPAADTIFDTARRRVYSGELKADGQDFPATVRPVLEEQPKWAILSNVLQEIEQDVYFNPAGGGDSNGTILIMSGDQSSCRQIREYLQTMFVRPDENSLDDGKEDNSDYAPSAAFMMRRKLRNYFDWRKNFLRVKDSLFNEEKLAAPAASTTDNRSTASSRGGKAPPNKRRRVRGGGAAGAGSHRGVNGHASISGDRDAHVASLLAEIEPTEVENQQKGEIVTDPLENMDDFYELYETKDLVLVHPYDGDMDEQVLEEVRPRYIIMYEPDPAFIRRVEVYRNSHSDRKVRLFFMYYGKSVEEQRFLSAVRREKDAFTKLIKERATMSLTITTDAHGVEDPQERFLRTVNTRIAGGGRLAATAEPPRVVVDVREFRSSLPSLLHGRSLQVVPCMLTVGDYVLTPNICVERKSVRDLISSFNNGRLYNQAETMLHHYKDPFLLIEFDQDKSFTLEPFADLTMSGASSLASLNPQVSSDVQSKLVLLTLAFPRLKIIWSSTPYQTAEIFEELKKNNEEPDPMTAVQIGLEGGDEDLEGQTFNQTPQDMMRAIPGVTAKNLSRLTLEVESILELSNMEENDIEPLVGREAGRQIARFFNRCLFDE